MGGRHMLSCVNLGSLISLSESSIYSPIQRKLWGNGKNPPPLPKKPGSSLRSKAIASWRRIAWQGWPMHVLTSGNLAKESQRRRSEEHTSELQSHSDLVCRLLLEKKKQLNDTEN